MKKTFVSLSFSSTHLQVLELNSSKTHVVRSGTVEIPSGLIQNSKVVDIPKMSEVIKGAYKKFGLKEKIVGIVVPEFSTYTRTLTLPNLEYKELDEAVVWKMKEYLPESGVGMVMDWQILNRNEHSNMVLVVAISETVLASFVQSAESAGLLPLVVETPALALARLGASDKESKMAIYANNKEGLVLYLRGNEILGSVVANSDDAESLIKLSYQMSRHYTETPAKKLLLGGLDITQSTMKQLQESLDLPVEWFKTQVSGVDPSTAQQYLIPLSLQFKDPAAPADENTINLLPARWAKTYKDKNTHSKIWLLVMITSVVCLMCLMATIGTNLIINQQLNNLKNEKAEVSEAPEDLVDAVNQANKNSSNVIKIINSTKDPIEILNTISLVRPAGVTIAKYDVDLEEGVIGLSGVSLDRQSLVDFKNKLEENSDFGSVDIPLASLQRETDIPFNLNFDYLPSKKAKPTAPPRLQ